MTQGEMDESEVKSWQAGRCHLISALDAMLPQLRYETSILAVLVLDVDRFGVINDSFGTEAGDEILETVLDRLAAVRRSVDRLSRLSGDAFVLIAENVRDAPEALRLATRLGAAVAKPMKVGDSEVVVTVSIGVATTAISGLDARALLRDAETAMHQAKRLGGGRFILFERAVRSQVLARVELERELRRGPAYATIVRAVTRLAHELGETVVAEGVESAEQRDQLEWLGCDLAQGYLWSPALHAEDFRRWLTSARQLRGDQAAAASVFPDPHGTGPTTEGSNLE